MGDGVIGICETPKLCFGLLARCREESVGLMCDEKHERGAWDMRYVEIPQTLLAT